MFSFNSEQYIKFRAKPRPYVLVSVKSERTAKEQRIERERGKHREGRMDHHTWSGNQGVKGRSIESYAHAFSVSSLQYLSPHTYSTNSKRDDNIRVQRQLTYPATAPTTQAKCTTNYCKRRALHSTQTHSSVHK